MYDCAYVHMYVKLQCGIIIAHSYNSISIEVTAVQCIIWAQPVSAGIDTSTHPCVHHTAKMSIMVSTNYNMMHSQETPIYGPVCQYYRTN